MSETLETLIIEPERTANAAIIWLHGLGADCHDFEPIVPYLSLHSDIKARFIFPQAPTIPISMNMGYAMSGWFDIKALDGGGRSIDTKQLLASAMQVHKLIDDEIDKGIDSERIILIGFSQGGAVNYQAGLTYDKPLAGMIALSSFFPTAEDVITHPVNQQLPMLICHGTQDLILDISLAEKSLQALEGLGYHPGFKRYQMAHTVCPEQITDIADWLNAQL